MLPAAVEVVVDDRDLSTGALPEVVGALRGTAEGELLAVRGRSPRLRRDLLLWSRLTGHGLVEVLELPDGTVRFVVRKGRAPTDSEAEAGPGERLWIYTNYHCNLACDYCCVRSSPTALARVLPLETVRRVAEEARELRFRRILITGGEPLLAPSARETIRACTDSLPTTVLTNGTLLAGPWGTVLATLPRDRLVLQISLDSPNPEIHDRHRGAGSWVRAWAGIERARHLGFRVRVAATLSEPAQRREMEAWLASEGFGLEDRVVRPVARRGAAAAGVTLSRADVVPEVTITAQGVYWHPVGADDDDFLVARPIPPLEEALETIQHLWNDERAVTQGLAEVFHCA